MNVFQAFLTNIFVTRSDGGTYLSEDKSDLVLYSRHGLVLSFDTDEVPRGNFELIPMTISKLHVEFYKKVTTRSERLI